MTDHTIHFHLDGIHNREARHWNTPGKDGIIRHGIRTAARRHAKKHGAAGMWFCSDKFTLFYRDFDGQVRQKTWKHGRPLKCECHG